MGRVSKQSLLNLKICTSLSNWSWQFGRVIQEAVQAYLSKFDGLKKKLIDAGSPVDANVSGYTGATGTITAITAANVVSVLQGIYKAIPTEIVDADDLHIFCGNDVYRLAVLGLHKLELV